MRRIDILTSIGLLGFVALMVLVIMPRESGGGVWHGLSPYFYPAVMLAGVALSSVGLLVQALLRPGIYEDQPARPLSREELGFFLLVSALIFGAVLVFHFFGTWAGGLVLIAAIMAFMGELNPVRIAAVALPTVAISYAIIVWGLKIPLP
ncbi:MAG: tripartite tricarboxylate transporter TctB family protein [Hyphomicrobiaceae bacterium]